MLFDSLTFLFVCFLGGGGGAATEGRRADPLREDTGDDGPQDPVPAVAMDTTD